MFGFKSRKKKNKEKNATATANGALGGSNAVAQAQIGGGGGSVLSSAQRRKQRKQEAKRDKIKRNELHSPSKLRGRDRKYMKSLGGGSANDVYHAKYKKEIGGSGTKEGFWKASEGNEAAKSLASSRLDTFLGTNNLSTDIEATHKGQLGITSAKVDGHALSKNLFDRDVTETYMEQYAGLDLTTYEQIKAEIIKDEMGASHKFDDENKTIHAMSGAELADVDFKNPEVQRGLANLQVLDYLTGQEDRHEGNIYIDPHSGKVKGIDNDMAFSSKMDHAGYQEAGDNDKNSKIQGMPTKIDADLGMRLQAMDESEFLKILQGSGKDSSHLSEDEIKAAIDRFRHLKVVVDDMYMNDEFTWQWNDDTYDEQVQSGKGYLARGVADRAHPGTQLKPRTGRVA